MDIFRKQKLAALSGLDLSRKGSVDAPIVDLIQQINDQVQYFTTSSCSGRVCIVEEDNASQVKKKGCGWLLMSHQKVEQDEVRAAVKKITSDAEFKFEPFVLHVQCQTLEAAQSLHSVAVASGFRNSGITVGKKGKIITAVRSTHSLDVPLSTQGRVLVGDEYLDYISQLANNKMDENLARIARFQSNFTQLVESSGKDVEVKQAKKNKGEYRRKRKQHLSHDKEPKERTEHDAENDNVTDEDSQVDAVVNLFEDAPS